MDVEILVKGLSTYFCFIEITNLLLQAIKLHPSNKTKWQPPLVKWRGEKHSSLIYLTLGSSFRDVWFTRIIFCSWIPRILQLAYNSSFLKNCFKIKKSFKMRKFYFMYFVYCAILHLNKPYSICKTFYYAIIHILTAYFRKHCCSWNVAQKSIIFMSIKNKINAALVKSFTI